MRNPWNWVIGFVVVCALVLAGYYVFPGPQIREARFDLVMQEKARVSAVNDLATQVGQLSKQVDKLSQSPAVVVTQPAPAAPAAQSQPAQPALPAVAVNCPTEKEFEALTGVRADIVRTEPCLFHWRGDPQQIVATHPCPTGWSCTLGSNGKNYQYNGDDKLAPMPIFAGSWRLLSQYAANDPVQNSCNFVVKVQAEGQISDPQWTVAPGNFTCP